MSDFKAKMHKIRFRYSAGLRPRPRLESLQRSHRPLVGWEGDPLPIPHPPRRLRRLDPDPTPKLLGWPRSSRLHCSILSHVTVDRRTLHAYSLLVPPLKLCLLSPIGEVGVAL